MDKLVYETGFGILPKTLMTNTELSIQAKAIYAYLVTFAGNGDTAFPSRSLISHHLGISKDTLSKYLKELRDKGYIEVTNIRGERGKFGHNVYRLIPSPKTPCPNSSDTVNYDTVPYPKIPDTVTPDTVTPDTVNSDTKINSNKKNNNKINSIKKNSGPVLLPKEIYVLYEKNIGPINNQIEKDLIDILNKIDLDLFNRAIEICKEKGVINHNYLKGIVNKWLQNNITTYAKLKEYENKITPKKNTVKPKTVQTRYHGQFNEHFRGYDPEELERKLLKAQERKRKKEGA